MVKVTKGHTRMRKRIRLLAALSLTVFLLGGCGTPLYEMSEEEEGLIVQYAAYALAKHNIYQKDGMTNAVPPEEQEESQAADETEAAEEGQIPEGGTDSGSGEESQQAVSIAKAVGMEEKLKISCIGSSVTDTYQEGAYFSVNASENKKLLVMEFKLKNISGEALKMDTASTGGSFSCCLDGEKQIPEKKTFGGRILSSFSGSIKAKGTQKLYLIFEVPAEMAKNSKSQELYVTIDGQNYSVKL